MEVKIVNQSPHPLPNYETLLSAGMDLRVWLKEPVVVKPGQRILLGTGLYIELPEGYEAQIRPRSGLAFKWGITVLNSPGTIDGDYRGEIKVLLINHSSEEVKIEDGMRVAQMIIAPVARITWKQVDKLSPTSRGKGGYGHTGV